MLARKSRRLRSLPACINARENPSAAATKTVWPSGLRRWLKAPFRKGAGSNPAAVILLKTATYWHTQISTPIAMECKISLRSVVAATAQTIRTAFTGEHDMVPFILASRGESGWCSDVTSTHGAWRHAGVRFPLCGVFRKCSCVLSAIAERGFDPRTFGL